MWLALSLGCVGGQGAEEDAVILLEDPNNYTFDSAITVEQIAVAPQSDLRVDWSGVVRDVRCHDLDPATVTKAALAWFEDLAPEEVTDWLNGGSQQADLTNYVDYDNAGGTDATLSAFTYFGTPVAQQCLTVGGGTCLAYVQTGDGIGEGIRAWSFVVPTTGETDVEVALPDPCGSLEWTVDLEGAEAVAIPAEGPWVVDWSGLTVDGRGGILDMADIDRLTVAHYVGETLASLEERFLDLDLIADGWWSMRIAAGDGARVDLEGLTGETGDREGADGDEFTGFDGDGVWLIGLGCSGCADQAPLFLGVVQAE